MLSVAEAADIVGVVLEGFELTFAKGIVIADARPEIAGADTELGEQIAEAVSAKRSECMSVIAGSRSATLS